MNLIKKQRTLAYQIALRLVKKYIKQSAYLSKGVNSIQSAVNRERRCVDLCGKLAWKMPPSSISNKELYNLYREAQEVYKEWHAAKDYQSSFGCWCLTGYWDFSLI